VQAGNGQEALVCLARPWQQVDVILCDVVMPRLGGIGLVKALRKDGVTTPVILMSGYAAGEARTGLREAGVTAWLDKPPSSAALAGALAAATGGRLVRG
jgi:CheY-like chemotaxis protein